MSVIQISQIIVALLLSVSILMQSKGTGLGSAWGGSGEFYRTKRGAERLLFTATIILAIAFVVLSLANLILS